MLLIVSQLFTVAQIAGADDKSNTLEQSKQKGVLLATFGTSFPEAKKVYQNIEKIAQERFPDYKIKWAYTSEKIRKKLAKQGELIDSVETALNKFKEEKIESVFVQSLHIIPGIEYNEVLNEVEKHINNFRILKVSPPLLFSAKDLKKTAEIMISKVPPERQKDDAVLFMGHGSPEHFSDLIYLATAHVLSKLDNNAFIASVEGSPDFNETLDEIKRRNFKKIFLIPFMSVAGDHALNDMAGDDEESWKSIIKKNGMEVIPVLKGMAGYDEIVNIWLDHLEETIKEDSRRFYLK